MARVTRPVLEVDASPATANPDPPAVRSGASVVPPRAIRTVDRLRNPMPADRLRGWLVTLVVTAIAFVTRLPGLGYPNTLVFDETYYAKDAYSLLRFGYERNWPDKANAQVVAGQVDVMQQTAEFVVHPPVGKWLIAIGEQLFGMNSFGWRVAPLVFGTLLVLVSIRLVRRVSRSTLIGAWPGCCWPSTGWRS